MNPIKKSMKMNKKHDKKFPVNTNLILKSYENIFLIFFDYLLLTKF